MSNEKQLYLKSIRAQSVYPTYRGIIGTVAFLGYLLALTILVVGSYGGYKLVSTASEIAADGLISSEDQATTTGTSMIVTSVVMALVIFIATRFFKEVATVLVDMSDSIVESNSRETQAVSTKDNSSETS